MLRGMVLFFDIFAKRDLWSIRSLIDCLPSPARKGYTITKLLLDSQLPKLRKCKVSHIKSWIRQLNSDIKQVFGEKVSAVCMQNPDKRFITCLAEHQSQVKGK